MAVKWHLQLLSLSSLTAWHKNPRQLSQAQYKQIQTSMDTFGLIEKPVVNADAENTVIGGHQRLRVLYDQGVKEVECWLPERELSRREIEELNIRLNRNLGSFDFDVLANEFEVGDLLEWGFSEVELQIDGLADALGGDSSSSDGDGSSGRDGATAAGDSGYYGLIVECDSESARAQLASRLGAEGYVCRQMDEGVVASAMLTVDTAVSDFSMLPEIQWSPQNNIRGSDG